MVGKAMNVLLLCVDDLRPELGCYGAEGMSTPHIDRLAGEGLRFENAHCQMATCGPSRVALLTGMRPQTTGAVAQWADYRELMPELVAMPQLFRDAGWRTYALGKIHHGYGEIDDERSWSEGCWRPERWQRYYAKEESQAAVAEALESWTRRDAEPRVLALEAPEVADSELPDGQIAEEAIRFLREPHGEPFFLAVGFLKPHLPFVAPKRYWDLYPPRSPEALAALAERSMPQGAPAYASNQSSELLGYASIREGGLGPEVQDELIRGYRACVSFVDAQVGRVLKALEEQDLADSTIVVLWGDHGWHLGDQGMWGKHTNYEWATRTPLVLRVPGLDGGGVTAGLVESVDLYPTLAELCGLNPPGDLEGLSFVPLLKSPGQAWKAGVFSEYHRRHAALGKILGRSLRTRDHRLVEWEASGSGEIETELYDLRNSSVERTNLADHAQQAALLQELRGQLSAGWRGSLPPDVAAQSTPQNSDSSD